MEQRNHKASRVIGVMSGTSLDGLDLACCHFSFNDGRWEYKVLKAQTIDYPDGLCRKLSQAMRLSGYELALLDVELGRFIGKSIRHFTDGFSENVALIASHGHTVFHRPDLGLTTQIGNGAAIAAESGLDCVCDFRTTDVALGGQGAPLVPIGDELLFGQYDICLNLGGISNLSFSHNGKRIAYDISPCNIALNYLSQQMGLAYDRDGKAAAGGKVDATLFNTLNGLDYYRLEGTKSLGREWIDSCFIPILKNSKLSVADQLRTVCEHIAYQVAGACHKTDGKKLFITGGGAHNAFLIGCIRQHFNGEVIIPDNETIDFKEAIIFAFLGFLRMQGINNCLASVTGARTDSCGGAIYSRVE